jgi:hypothetical protein
MVPVFSEAWIDDAFIELGFGHKGFEFFLKFLCKMRISIIYSFSWLLVNKIFLSTSPEGAGRPLPSIFVTSNTGSYTNSREGHDLPRVQVHGYLTLPNSSDESSTNLSRILNRDFNIPDDDTGDYYNDHGSSWLLIEGNSAEVANNPKVKTALIKSYIEMNASEVVDILDGDDESLSWFVPTADLILLIGITNPIDLSSTSSTTIAVVSILGVLTEALLFVLDGKSHDGYDSKDTTLLFSRLDKILQTDFGELISLLEEVIIWMSSLPHNSGRSQSDSVSFEVQEVSRSLNIAKKLFSGVNIYVDGLTDLSSDNSGNGLFLIESASQIEMTNVHADKIQRLLAPHAGEGDRYAEFVSWFAETETQSFKMFLSGHDESTSSTTTTQKKHHAEIFAQISSSSSHSYATDSTQLDLAPQALSSPSPFDAPLPATNAKPKNHQKSMLYRLQQVVSELSAYTPVHSLMLMCKLEMNFVGFLSSLMFLGPAELNAIHVLNFLTTVIEALDGLLEDSVDNFSIFPVRGSELDNLPVYSRNIYNMVFDAIEMFEGTA